MLRPQRAVGRRSGTKRLPLDAEHLLELVHDVDEIALGSDDVVDVFIGGRDLVDHARVFTAFDRSRLRDEIVLRIPALGFVSTHTTAGAVRTGVERIRVAFPANDERPRAHRSRDDAEFARSRADGTFTRDEDLLAEMQLDRRLLLRGVL